MDLVSRARMVKQASSEDIVNGGLVGMTLAAGNSARDINFRNAWGKVQGQKVGDVFSPGAKKIPSRIMKGYAAGSLGGLLLSHLRQRHSGYYPG